MPKSSRQLGHQISHFSAEEEEPVSTKRGWSVPVIQWTLLHIEARWEGGSEEAVAQTTTASVVLMAVPRSGRSWERRPRPEEPVRARDCAGNFCNLK